MGFYAFCSHSAHMADSLVLTQANVRTLRYTRTDEQPQITWDKTMIGLGVRVTANGAKSFVLRYRTLGRQRLATLGATHIHSVDKARSWARDGLSQADKGIDFQAAAEQQKALGTVAQLWRRYIDEHVKVHGAERTANDLESLWRTHLEKSFASKRVTEVITANVRSWHRRASERRVVDVKRADGSVLHKPIGGAYSANRAMQALRAAFNWQIAEGTLPPEFRNPCVGVGLNHEKPRDVILRPSELPALAKAIEAHEDIYARAFVWLAIYTGARRGELLALQWPHVDLKAKRVTFINTKNKTDRTVPLASDAVQVLNNVPRIDDNPYVFPGRWGNGHRINVTDAWQEIRKAAKLPHLHLHDVRRSVGSWLGAAGHTAPMIGELLGHKSDVTSRVYIKLGSLDVKQELVTVQEGLIKGALNPKPKKSRKRMKLKKERAK